MTPYDPRDLEWQRRYEQNDTPWDKGVPAPPLIRFLKSNVIAGRVLVPGCGRGHEVRLLAAQTCDEVVGLDIAPSAVAEATERAPSEGASGARFIVGDFLFPPPDWRGTFDWLVEHTCFCALSPDRRSDYVTAASFVLKPGGKLFGIFYLTPDTESGPPFAVSREELSTLFGPSFDLIGEWVPEESFPGREKRELVQILQKRESPSP